LSVGRNLKTIFHQWGGGTAVFFSYTHLSHDLCTGLLTALLPLIKESLGLSYLQSGLLLSAYTITSGLSQFAGGWIGDRLRRNIVITVGLGGISLMAVAVGLSPAYYPMLFILVVMGIFAGAYHPSAVSLLSGYYDERKRGKVIALHMAGGSIGFAMGPILGGLIAEFLGWRFAFIILALPALSAVPLILKKFRQQEPVIQEPTTDDNTTQQPIQRGLSIFQALKPIAIIFILTVSTQLVAGSAMAFIPIYLVDKHNIAPGYAAMMLGIIRGAGIVGSLFGGWLSDRWGRKNAIFLTLVATGPVLYLLTILTFNAGLVMVFILFGMFMYMRQATVQPAFGIYFGLSMEGMSLVQPVAGHFMDIFGIVEVFTVIALISVGLSLVALFLAKKA